MKSSRDDTDDVIEIDLKDLFGYLLHWTWIIVVCGVLAGLAGYLVSSLAVTPLYQSTTTVYILNKQDNNGNLTYSDLQLGSQLTADYALLIKSRTVLEQVIENYGLSISYEQFAGQVDVNSVDNTRSINITVTNPDPAMAMQLANQIREIAAQHITSVMDIQAVNLVDAANLPTHPSSPSIARWTAVGALLGLLLCVAVLSVHFLMDDTIKNSEDIEKYLDLSVLAMIPKQESGGRNRSKRHGAKGADVRAGRMTQKVYESKDSDDLVDISNEIGGETNAGY